MNHREDTSEENPLEPGEVDARRLVSIDRIRSLINSSGNPQFLRQCQAFIEAIEPEDRLIEFCTSKESWRQCQGSYGYLVERQGSTVAKLITRFN